MRINLEKVSQLGRKLSIEVPQDIVQAEFKKAYLSVRSQVAIKGFRKGHAPIATIRSIYGDRIRQQVAESLVQTHYAQALHEEKVDPISYPTIEFDDLSEAASFAFTAEFEVRPEVQVKQHEGLHLLTERWTLDPAEVEERLESLRSSRGKLESATEGATVANADYVRVGVRVTKESGEPMPGFDHETTQMVIAGSGKQLPPEVDAALIGLKVGEEKSTPTTLSQEVSEPEMRGLKVVFHTRIVELHKLVLPELNDSFAKEAAGVESLAALRERLTQEITGENQRRIRDELRERALRALCTANPLEVPVALVNEQKSALIKDFRGKYGPKPAKSANQPATDPELEKYIVENDSNFKESAQLMVQGMFLVDALASSLKIRADDAAIEDKLNEYAASTGVELQRVRDFYSEGDRRSRLASKITQDRILDYVIEKAVVQEVPRAQLEKDDSQ